jgi:hypothetical protein
MRSAAPTLVLLAVATLPATAFSQPLPTVLEEVVAVVGESPVLESDLRLARLVGLVDTTEGRASRSELLTARVRLELQFTDLEASGSLFRLQLDVDDALQHLVESGGGAAQVRQGLAEEGLSWDDLRGLAVRVAAATAFTEQRLRPRIRLTAEELRTAYQEELTPRLAERGQTPPPFPEVRELLHRLLSERRLNDQIEEWLSTARTQHPVTIFRP